MRKKIKLFFFIAGPTLILLLAAYLIFFSKFFIVKFVEVKGEDLSCADKKNLLDHANIAGDNFFLINNPNIEKKLKDQFSCVKSVKIRKNLPNRVILDVSNRQPVAKIMVLKTNQATSSAVLDNFLRSSTPSAETREIEKSFSIDQEGILFQDNQETKPRIYLEKENMEFGKIFSILNKIKFFGIEIMEVTIVEDTLLIPSSPKMIFALDKNIDTQLASLQLILSKAKIDEETIEFIDLRFDKPVVRFAPKKK